MKKNNKYRPLNNHNNQIYSLNYKFDSISPAGKISGTALDLIKRYNELAKEAQGNADYVEAENFRQYAEHYRKIVTEINERKNQRSNYSNPQEEKAEESSIKENVSSQDIVQDINNNVENNPTTSNSDADAATPVKKRSFKVIEIKSENSEENSVKPTKTRTRTPRKPKVEAVAQ